MSNMSILTDKQVQIRNILKSTYSYMTGGLLITALVAWLTATSLRVISPGMMIVAILAELGMVFYLSAKIMSLAPSTAALIFWIYSALNGFTLSMVVRVYTGASIFSAFVVAAGAFAGMSLYALVTKNDLSGLGKYLMMGLFGLIIMGLMSMFLPGMSMFYSLIGLILFMGLTAYDTQIIKRWGEEYGDSIPYDDYKRLSIIGALKLYLDFVNIFLFLLRFLGVARRN